MSIKGAGKESSLAQGITANVSLSDLELKKIWASSASLPGASLPVVEEIMLGSVRQK